MTPSLLAQALADVPWLNSWFSACNYASMPQGRHWSLLDLFDGSRFSCGNFLDHRHRAIAVKRGSHSRPEHVPKSKRERMLQRPQNTFMGRTGRRKQDRDLYFGNWPLDPSAHSQARQGRNPKFGYWRAKLKESRSAKSLRECLYAAIRQGEVDASVISCAMQKCGYNRWWETLLQVHEAQDRCNVALSGIQARIFLTAIASCLKDQRLSEATLASRYGLHLGKSIWHAMPSPTSEFDFNPAVGSAWYLCAAVGPEALQWAKEIAEWSETVPATINIISYTSFLSLLERCKLHAEVDELLDQISRSEDASPNAVLLGNLINEAGMLLNWRRADFIWDKLVSYLAVEPNHICYVAYAKAHLLAARPTVAVRILDRMRKAGLGSGNGQASVLQLQCLLLLCHSSPTESHLSDLATFLEGSAGLNVTGSGRLLESEWRQLRNSATQLSSEPSSLTLHQLLVLYHVKRRSLMTTWPDYAAGSEYLSSQSSEVKP